MTCRGVEQHGLHAPHTYAEAIGNVFTIAAGIALVSLLASLAIEPLPRVPVHRILRIRGAHDRA
ncbi:hypothetical protein [Streptomyces sp. NPDC051776]|uniref:hypothetical protein n=1 Tax=Streptomyces sp. NPDC051776 TaxID=3155414 RepID=UPI00342ABA5D